MTQYVYVNGYLDVARTSAQPYQGTSGLVLECARMILIYEEFVFYFIVILLLVQMLSVHPTTTLMVVLILLLILDVQGLLPKYYAMLLWLFIFHLMEILSSILVPSQSTEQVQTSLTHHQVDAMPL